MTQLSDSEIWDANATLWNSKINEGNDFYRYLVAPTTKHLLNLTKDDVLLDIGCGNGHFIHAEASHVCELWGVDISKKLIDIAEKKASSLDINNATFRVVDATNAKDLSSLPSAYFSTITCNMALMDIAELKAISCAIARIMKPKGRFVFSVSHPSFNQPGTSFIQKLEDCEGTIVETNSLNIHKYSTSHQKPTLAFVEQKTPHNQYHRSFSNLLRPFLEAGLIINAIEEPTFSIEKEKINAFVWGRYTDIPPIIICRLEGKSY